MSKPIALPPALPILKRHSDWSLARLAQWSQMQRECHRLNAYVEAEAKTPPSELTGPLAGVPVSVQLGLDPEQHLGQLCAQETVERLRALGALICGHTQVSRFGLADGNFAPSDAPLNPWCLGEQQAYVGANAGAAASLFSGAMISLSADNGGALCASASAYGVVGFRPSHAEQYNDPFHLGYMAQRISDIAYLYCLEQWGEAGLQNYHTIKLSAEHYQPQLQLPSGRLGAHCSPAAHLPFTRALEQWMGCGVNLRNRAFDSAERFCTTLERGPDLAQLRVAERLVQQPPTDDLSQLPDTLASLDEARGFSSAKRLMRAAELQLGAQEVGEALHCEDILLCPTLTDSAYHSEGSQGAGAMPKRLMQNTRFASASNCCALTLPGPLDAHGLPSGVLLLAPSGQEIHLLSVGLAIEQRWGTADARLGIAPRLAA